MKRERQRGASLAVYLDTGDMSEKFASIHMRFLPTSEPGCGSKSE